MAPWDSHHCHKENCRKNTPDFGLGFQNTATFQKKLQKNTTSSNFAKKH
jgi:hypothetical protein